MVILAHNKKEYTQGCLESLLETEYDPWELIVIDNGSDDGTVEWLLEFKTRAAKKNIEMKIKLNENNAGCSTARNQGIDLSRGKKIVFMDNDTALRQRSWMKGLADVLDSQSSIGLAGPKLVYPYPPYDIQFAGGAVSPSGRVQFMGRGESRQDMRFTQQKEVQCYISACYMVKRKVLDVAGGFDEIFNPVEYEDIDHSYRIKAAGFRLIYVPSVELYHFESVTTNGTPNLSNTYLIIKNGLKFKHRWKHCYENENGPNDDDTQWKNIPVKRLADIKSLEVCP